jgi:hypothetical protein
VKIEMGYGKNEDNSRPYYWESTSGRLHNRLFFIQGGMSRKIRLKISSIRKTVKLGL